MEYRRFFLALSLGSLLAAFLFVGCRREPEAEPAPEVVEDEILETPLVGSPLPEREPVIRIRVHRIRERGTEEDILLGRAGQRLAVKHLAFDSDLELQAPVVIRSGARGWVLIEADGRRTQADGVGAIEFVDAAGGSIRLQPRDRQYPGTIRLHWRSDVGIGAFDVINHVGLEIYLPGVLASELYHHWHEQAFEAQAIAARSFASSEQAYFSNRRHFDVTDTVSSQVYSGEVDLRKAQLAAEKTRGIVLAFEDRLVAGYYSSCCGGIAAQAPDVIGPNAINAIKPLLGRAEHDVCIEAPRYEWTILRTASRLARRLAAFGARRGNKSLAELGSIRSIEVASRNPHERPVRYRITPRSGEPFELDAETLMQAMNYSGSGIEAPDQSLHSSFIDVKAEGDRFRIIGHGFGHGVGLCQYGAQTMASQGRTHSEILAWYYPGAELLQAYR